MLAVVGVGERGLAERERVGGLLARGFGLGEFVGERMGAAGEFGRRVGDRRPLPLRLGAPLGEFGDPGERASAPLGPRRPLGGDGRAPGGAGLGLALERLRRGARFHERRPLLRRRRAGALEGKRDFVAGPEALEGGLGIRLALGRLVQRRAGARERLVDRREPRQGLGALTLEFGEGVAGGVQTYARGAHALAPIGFGCGGLARGFRRGCGLGGERGDRLARGFGLALEVAETIFFKQAPRGRSWRFGRSDEAVPAPEVAFDRNQPLAGLEQPAEPLPSARATMPTCARRRASAGGAATRAASGSAPGGKGGSSPAGAISDQCAGA